MDKKSLMLGSVVGVLFGSLVAGSLVFASTNAVQAQKETVNYDGIQGTALVYGGTTYAELYAVQQVLKQQGIVNKWTGSAFTMASSSQSNKELAAQNQQLTQQVSSLNSIFKNLSQVPTSEQQQLLNRLSQVASSSQSSTDMQNIAQGLQQAANETAGKPGLANTIIQNIINGIPNGKSSNSPLTGGTQSGTAATSTTTSTYGTSTSSLPSSPTGPMN